MKKDELSDFELFRILLRNARAHLKLVFGLTATRPPVHYLDVFSFGRHTTFGADLALTPGEEEEAFTALEHCAIHLSVVQIHTILERLHAPNHFSIREQEIADAFQIVRLIRNSFAHNPFNPVWDIRPNWRDRNFSVANILSLKTTDLDKTPVKREHYGGPIAILRLFDYVEGIISLREAECSNEPVS